MPLARLSSVRVLSPILVFLVLLSVDPISAHGQLNVPDPGRGIEIEAALQRSDPGELYARSLAEGNAVRGAILFHGPLLGCGRCHKVGASSSDLLGPNLSLPRPEENAAQLLESVLRPSAKVDAKYQTTRVVTADGKIVTGLLLEGSESEGVKLRLVDSLQEIAIGAEDIEQVVQSKTSLMPAGLMQQLSNDSEFLDLIKYLVEIREGGAKRARELQPSAAQLAIQLPEYESRIDHAGMISDWDAASYARGEAVYQGLCVNCHGNKQRAGSLATALRFGEGKFKYGADPFSMYQTLTRGAGLMLPQTWMVPQQKYDVIHYLREAYLKEDNPSQYVAVTEKYLNGLPVGDERGPEPRKLEPWSQADYGPRLVNTYEIGRGGTNIAQKGIALQLDGGPGGVAQGQAWVVFEHDTLRVAGVWTSQGFIDWHGIHFDGRHGIHPHVTGDVLVSNPTGPGWAEPRTGSLEDDRRVVGRDGKRYGPLPRSWAKYRGIYQQGRKSLIAYTVGATEILETFDWKGNVDGTLQTPGLFARHLQIGARPSALELVVSTLEEDDESEWQITDGMAVARVDAPTNSRKSSQFDGSKYFEIDGVGSLDFWNSDFSIVADVTLSGDGTIFAVAPNAEEWGPNGQALFVRDGKLTFDIGWVGALSSSRTVADGKPHRVALSWAKKRGVATLWVDGEQVGRKQLAAKRVLADPVMRIGKTSSNFPTKSPLEAGEIRRVAIYQRTIEASDFQPQPTKAAAVWDLTSAQEGASETSEAVGSPPGLRARPMTGASKQRGSPMAGFFCDTKEGVQFKRRDRKLVLAVPTGDEDIHLSVWSSRIDAPAQEAEMAEAAALHFGNQTQEVVKERFDTNPSTPLFPEEVKTTVKFGLEDEGVAVDFLSIPTENPWRARVRGSGIDFFADGDRLAMCTWDGDVWIASGLSALRGNTKAAGAELSWRRIAFGLFQPLGLKILDGTIYLTCRDQIVRLDDRNGDGEIDYYHCVNSDHQVTEHFHEFAMGLQVDDSGNFYYAKSARHAKQAVVPHHGTLLRVSPDGYETEILATGFRAANGVCLNSDGSFIVTDQEGHWNPKNRINWVREGGFYGNMYGYHDVTDESDEAMDAPLCWITNSFDRSPSELLWANSPAWGPLEGQLLNLSYGYGRVYVVPHEEVEGQMQGGMCALPIKDLPTGTMRGRFSVFDGALYLCGLSAWGTNQMMNEGGLYRIRLTGKPLAMPVALSARKDGLRIGLSEPLSADADLETDNFQVRTWALKRTKNYGSKHYDERALQIADVKLNEARDEIHLSVPEIAPTWCMEIRMDLPTSDGRTAERVIHNTIYNLAP